MKKNQNPFKIVWDDRIPTMLGRDCILNRLKQQLTKTDPVNISVVGPKRFGKTVILNRLAEVIAAEDNKYLAVCYWDLRHGTPQSDEEFKKQFAERIKTALENVHSPLAEYLEMDSESLFELLKLVFDEMEKEGKRILAVLDGFDHVLAGIHITRNLWDNLLDLVRRPGRNLRLVTGSRGRLRELCRTEESRTSDFWEIFEPDPIEVGHMEPNDLEGLLTPFTERKIEFESSARKELLNWTGGIPVLLAGILRQLFEEIEDGAAVTGEIINRLAQELSKSHHDILAELWEDCPEKVRFYLNEISQRDIPTNDKNIPESELYSRGLADKSGNYLKSSCRLMKNFAMQQSEGESNMRVLFGEKAQYDQNIRSLLEIQIQQVKEINPDLLFFVNNFIRDMLPDPKYALVWIRNVADTALKLIWEKELPPDGNLPPEWTRDWQDSERDRTRWKEYYEEGSKLPSSKGDQLKILRLITGSERSNKTSKYVSKTTYLLVDHLVSVGNFGQHLDESGSTVSMGFAASVCFAAVELCKNLANELNHNSFNHETKKRRR